MKTNIQASERAIFLNSLVTGGGRPNAPIYENGEYTSLYKLIKAHEGELPLTGFPQLEAHEEAKFVRERLTLSSYFAVYLGKGMTLKGHTSVSEIYNSRKMGEPQIGWTGGDPIEVKIEEDGYYLLFNNFSEELPKLRPIQFLEVEYIPSDGQYRRGEIFRGLLVGWEVWELKVL